MAPDQVFKPERMIFWNAPGEVAFAELLQVVRPGLKEVVAMRLEIVFAQEKLVQERDRFL